MRSTSRADKYRGKVLQLFFDKEADIPLAWFSDWGLQERFESDNDAERAENQAQMVSVAMMTNFLENLANFSSPDWDKT